MTLLFLKYNINAIKTLTFEMHFNQRQLLLLKTTLKGKNLRKPFVLRKSNELYSFLVSLFKIWKLTQNKISYVLRVQNIRIFNSCEVHTENSVRTVIVRQDEACWMMPNSYPEWRNFQFAPSNHYGFFSCIPSLWKLHLNFHVHYFITITLKKYIFGQAMFCSAPTCDIDIKMFDGKWHKKKTDAITSKRHTNVM